MCLIRFCLCLCVSAHARMWGLGGRATRMIHHSNKIATVAAFVIFQLVGNCVKFHT
jgi:hypothetical protein